MNASLERATTEKEAHSNAQERAVASSPSSSERRRTLLVFDLNGLFVERVKGTVFAPLKESDDDARDDDDMNGPISSRTRNATTRRAIVTPDFKCANTNCFIRRFASEFIEWCHERFEVAVWSSAMEVNTNIMVNNVWREQRDKLAFILSQEHCATAGTMRTSDGRGIKPKFLKELSVVWEKFGVQRGYDATNTLLIDDSHYKVLRNPPNTAIHPAPFTVATRDFDIGLSASGCLRTYLEKLFQATGSVPDFVKANPFVDSGNLDEASAVAAMGAELAAMRVGEKMQTEPKPKTTQTVGKVYPKPKSIATQTTLLSKTESTDKVAR